MIYIYLALSIFISWISFKIFKDFTSPPVIISLVWSIMYQILIFSTYSYNSNDPYYIIFLLSNIFFVIGFFIVINGKKIPKINLNSSIDYHIRKRTINIFLIIEICVIIYLFIGIIKFLSTNFERNIWFSLKYGRAMGTYYEGAIVERFRVIANAISHILAISYFISNTKENRKYFFIQLILSLILNLTGTGRSTLFILIIPMIFSYIYIRKPNNKKVIKILGISAVFLLGIFVVYAYMKFPYLVGESGYKFIIGQLQIYTISPMIAFVEWCNLEHIYACGAYTFRFFIAILNAIGLNIAVPDLVNDYVKIGNDLTNVYTVLHYYAKDFGVFFSLIVQFFIGIFHGTCYKKVVFVNKYNMFSIAVFTLFYYALLMQFFLDQYISLLSLWIQYIICYYVVSKSNLLIVKKYRNDKAIN